MSHLVVKRVESIIEFARKQQTGIGIRPAHEHLESIGIPCSYKTVMRDFKWLTDEGRFAKRDGLYWLQGGSDA